MIIKNIGDLLPKSYAAKIRLVQFSSGSLSVTQRHAPESVVQRDRERVVFIFHIYSNLILLFIFHQLFFFSDSKYNVEVSSDVISVKLPQMDNVPLTNPIRIAFANRLVSYHQVTGFLHVCINYGRLLKWSLFLEQTVKEISQARNCKT